MLTGSEIEQQAIRTAYIEKSGNMPFILKRVPFLSTEDEPRVRRMLGDWMENGLIPKFDIEKTKSAAQSNNKN